MRERDARDASRAVAPLKPADGAFMLDTTGMTVNQAVEMVLHRYRLAIGM
jgi:CMP/dCMP kinase